MTGRRVESAATSVTLHCLPGAKAHSLSVARWKNSDCTCCPQVTDCVVSEKISHIYVVSEKILRDKSINLSFFSVLDTSSQTNHPSSHFDGCAPSSNLETATDDPGPSLEHLEPSHSCTTRTC